MTDGHDTGDRRRPTRRERFRPLELVGFAAGCGLFAGVIVLLGSRELELAAVFAGIAFIVALLVLAMLALAAGDVGAQDDPRPVLDRREPLPDQPDEEPRRDG